MTDQNPQPHVSTPELEAWLTVHSRACINHELQNINRFRYKGHSFWTRQYLKPTRTRGYYAIVETNECSYCVSIVNVLCCPQCRRLFIEADDFYTAQPATAECRYVLLSTGHTRRTFFNVDLIRLFTSAYLEIDGSHYFSRSCAGFEGN